MRVETADATDAAIAWQLRLATADEATWAAFIAWLEESPVHAEAYDRVAIADRRIGEARFPDPPVDEVADAGNDNVAPPRHWRWWGGGIAAAAMVALALVPTIHPHAQTYQVTTRDGERRSILLEDGTRIELSGGSQLTLERANPRVATLDHGEALFQVRHDPAAPFTLTIGTVAVQDLGTMFNVSHLDGRMTLAVGEGAVAFRPGAGAVTLRAGDALTARDDGGDLARSRVAPQLVGGWRSGRLSFVGQPLGEVAALLKRLYRTDIAMTGMLSDRPFTGVVQFTGVADHDVPRLAELIGATWRRDGGRWILVERVEEAP